MTTLTMDTLAYAKRLRGAGINDRQAEAMAEALAAEIYGAGGELATKADLVAGLAELRTEISALEVRLTNRLYGVAAGLAALILAGHGAVIFAMFRFLAP